MPLTNESALLLIGDEVRATLHGLNADLSALIDSDSSKRDLLFVECEKKIHTIAGALHMASVDALSRYAQVLQDMICAWQASPDAFSKQALTTVIAASQSLYDFLQAAQEKKSLSELVLFQDYQRLCRAMSRSLTPLDLWSASESQRCMNVWLEPDFVAALQIQIQRRLNFYDASAMQLSQIDVLMLALIRHKQVAAAATLQEICDWQGTQQASSQSLVCSTLLSAVIQALAQGSLELDVFLKRYLLSGLNWLKSRKSDDAFLNESTFFTYLAWQANLAEESDEPSSLEIFARAANWQKKKGTHYNQIYFDQQVRNRISQAHRAVLELKEVWNAFCSASPSLATNHQSFDLSLSFEKMGQAIEVLHPAAATLSQAFHAVVVNADLCSERHVQVEVATLLLILNSMLTDLNGLEDTQSEHRLLSLVRRLQAIKNGQPTGAFEPWMLELQQHQDWLQAMGSTTAQLGQKLTEIEGTFERLWAAPDEISELINVPTKLQQIRAIAYSLRLDDFADAVRLVEEKLDILVQSKQPMVESIQKEIASDIASLGLRLSMWAHKPEQQIPRAITIPSHALMQEESVEKIFLLEAHDVLKQAALDIQQMLRHLGDRESFMGLKRTFHTLKGGARVAGLMEYGEAAGLLEQHLDERLAQQASLPTELLELCLAQVKLMQSWTEQMDAPTSIEVSLPIDWQLDRLEQSLKSLSSSSFLDLQADSQIKTIDHLQISIPLYQAYLNETDEWSRQLALVFSEWALDNMQPLPSQTLTWAHALAGSSATIGFDSCAQMAKLVERLLERIHEQGLHSVDLAQTLSQAANEIRRLLHQFAAGFLKTADPLLIDLLQAYLTLSHAPPVNKEAAVDTSSSLLLAVQSPEPMPADAEMKAIFAEESAQLIPELGAALRIWDKAQALRTLHTLKGSARLVGEQVLAGRAHDLESKLEASGDMPDEAQIAQLLKDYDQLATDLAPPTRSITPSSAIAQPVSRPQTFAPISSGETIRIQSNTVDRLVNQTGELMIARSRMEAEMTRSLRTLSDMGSQVQRLRDQLREMELQTESQMQSRQAQVSDAANSFDPLELDRFTRTQELTRFMAEALSDISILQRNLQRSLNAAEDDLSAQLRQTRDLQRNLLRTRMVEFDSVGERLHRLVRMTSQELGKSVELTIQNGGQEMDRSVLERMLPVFEHLLRNAIVHGIESSIDRENKEKSAQGNITIQLTQQSNDVIVQLQDDGRGIDHEALLLKARDRSGDPDLNVDPAELIFMSGLSTASEVSEIAGRGIGMDVVRNQIFALGGRIEVTSIKDSGTSFKLILPLTTAVTQIILVRTGAQMTGVPGNLVSTIVRVKPSQVEQARQKKSFVHAEQAYPFFDLGQLLQYKPQAIELEHQPMQNMILLQSAGQMMALHVDEVIGNQEVMVKNLGTQLAQMPGLSGMTVLPTGPTVLIYNPIALAAIYGSHISEMLDQSAASTQTLSTQGKEKARQQPLVLVVDDSITMRRVLQRLLQREGYRVVMAADGRQALDTLRSERPMLVLSDVEMPRMDGFELLRSIRSSDKLHDLPVVMITSRIAEKHRDHAKELGANAYLGKPYSEDELLQVLERYASKEKVSQASV